MPESISVRAVTFNAWALPVTIPTQRKRQRLKRLPAALASLDADIIVLQELFDVRARRRLLQELVPPYVAAPLGTRARRILGLVPADSSGGLLVLSRLPIQTCRFVPHPSDLGAKLDERLGRKGMLIVRVESGVGPLTVAAIHLYAGIRPVDTRVRSTQLARLLTVLDAEANSTPVLLAGDINASPTVAFPEPPGADNPLTPEYAALRAAGFVDPLPPNPTPPELCVTWAPSRNRYAALPYQETRTDERYDYLLVRPGARRRWKIKNAGTVLDAPLLSDHIGVMAEFELVGDPAIED